jgi:hypothetical protein
VDVTTGGVNVGQTVDVSGDPRERIAGTLASVAHDGAVTVGVSDDAGGATGDVPAGVGEDVRLLVPTTEGPPTSAWELEVTTEVLELVQVALVEDAEDDGFQLVLEAEVDGDEQDAVGIAAVLSGAITDVVAVWKSSESHETMRRKDIHTVKGCGAGCIPAVPVQANTLNNSYGKSKIVAFSLVFQRMHTME